MSLNLILVYPKTEDKRLIKLLVSLSQIENQIKHFGERHLPWMSIKWPMLPQIFFRPNQILQAIVFELVIFLDYGRTPKILNLFAGHRNLNATSGYVSEMGDQKRQDRISQINTLNRLPKGLKSTINAFGEGIYVIIYIYILYFNIS